MSHSRESALREVCAGARCHGNTGAEILRHGVAGCSRSSRAARLAEKKLRRFYGTVQLDTLHLGRDAGMIGEPIIQHLSGLVGAEVTVTLDIHAALPDGAPDNVVRTVTENAKRKFDQFSFEEE